MIGEQMPPKALIRLYVVSLWSQNVGLISSSLSPTAPKL